MSDEEDYDAAIEKRLKGSLSERSSYGSIAPPLNVDPIPLKESKLSVDEQLSAHQLTTKKSPQVQSNDQVAEDQGNQPSVDKDQLDSDEDDSDGDLFEALVGGEETPVPGVSKKPVSNNANQPFDEEHTEVLIDEGPGELPNTYFSDEKGNIYHVKRSPFVIGRSVECDLVIDLKGVSRRHAELIFGEGHFTLRDLDSLNGTKVNGTPVNTQRLNDADVIKIGRSKLSFFTYTTQRSYRKPLSLANAQDHLRQTEALQPPPEDGQSHQKIDWLVKLNFILVSVIILVICGFLILDTMSSGPEVSNEPSRSTNTGTYGFMTEPMNDWTEEQNWTSPQLAQQQQVMVPREKSLETKSPQEIMAEEARIKAQAERIRLEAERLAREEELRAQEVELERERRQERLISELRSEALTLLENIEENYIKGTNLEQSLDRMAVLSKSDQINASLKRQLSEKEDIYRTLIDAFEEGKKLYSIPTQEDQAFKLWSEFLGDERQLLNLSQQSAFAKAIERGWIDKPQGQA